MNPYTGQEREAELNRTPAVGAVITALLLAGCSPRDAPPEFPSQVGRTYADAAKAVEAAGLDNADGGVESELYYEGGPRAGDWFVCTQDLSEPWEEGGPWSVHFELVASMEDCPGGKPRKGLEEAYQRRYDPPAPDDPLVLEQLSGKQYHASREYGRIPAVLRGANDEEGVARALGLKMSGPEVGTRLKDYCFPDREPGKYSDDRRGLVCRVGEDAYGTMVFRDDPDPGNPLWAGLYGIQAWFCCEEVVDLYDGD